MMSQVKDLPEVHTDSGPTGATLACTMPVWPRWVHPSHLLRAGHCSRGWSCRPHTPDKAPLLGTYLPSGRGERQTSTEMSSGTNTCYEEK